MIDQLGYYTIGQVLARESHRRPQGEAPPDPVCPVCKGLKVVKEYLAKNEQRSNSPYTGPTFARMIDCPTCSEPIRRRWLAANSGLGGPDLDHRLRHWETGIWPPGQQDRRQQRIAALKQMQTAIENRSGFYTFYGDFGAGKSFALAVVCNELRDAMVETHYVTLPAVFYHLRSLIASDQDWSHYWQRLLDVPVLALDEVTRFRETEWASEKMFVLANTRYQRRHSCLTLFATNDDPTTDSYLFSRMRDGVQIELRGDMRGNE